MDTQESLPQKPVVKIHKKRYIWALIAILSCFCAAGVYYEFFVKNTKPTQTPDVPGKPSVPEEKGQADAVPPDIVPAEDTPNVVGVNVGGVSIEKESRLVSLSRTSVIARLILVVSVVGFLIAIISYAVRMGFMLYHREALAAPWITISYGFFHLFLSILSLINLAVLGHSFFRNENKDFFSHFGRYAGIIFAVVASLIFLFDIALYIWPEQLGIFNIEGFYETITVMIGLKAGFPPWMMEVVKDGHVINPFGVSAHLFGATVAGMFTLSLLVKLVTGVSSDVQVLSIIITMISALMSALYSVYRLVVPSKKTSLIIQVVYLTIAIAGVVYGLKGTVWKPESLIMIVMMIIQLRTCLNLSFTNSSLFWTLISPFYVLELNV